jgi:hypothetical protein
VLVTAVDGDRGAVSSQLAQAGIDAERVFWI